VAAAGSVPGQAGYEEEVLRSLRRIIRTVDLYSRRLIVQHGLSAPQLVCLRQLQRHGPVSIGRLAEALQLSPATVSGILDRLEARGLAFRERDSADKRRVSVHLSAMGRETVRATPLPLQDGFLLKLRALSPRQQGEIQRVLKRLASMMGADDLDSEPLLAPADGASGRVASSKKTRS
jgi:DNA-binding MarR family transcriptional regulator